MRPGVEGFLEGCVSVRDSGISPEQAALEFDYSGWDGAGGGDSEDDWGELWADGVEKYGELCYNLILLEDYIIL